MSTTKVVNIKLGHRYDVYIGRAGKGEDGYFGNPFRREPGQSHGATLENFRVWFHKRVETDPVYRHRIHALKGKTLGCFCKPHPCHGDIIAQYLNALET